MKSEKLGIIMMLFAGLLFIYLGWFIYDVYKPVSNTDSSRLKDLNWLYENVGKIPTALLFATIGIFICILAFKKLKK